MSVALNVFRGLIAVAYSLGAATHVGNLAGRGPVAPPDKKKLWRTLDVVYLGLDLVVVVGMIIGAAWGYGAFFVAATSQLVLYVGFPGSFASSPAERRQLRGLVRFHVVTAAAMISLLVAAS